MKQRHNKFIPLAALVIGSALVYGSGKGGPISTLFSVGPSGASITWETSETGSTQVVERAETLINPVWTPVGTNTMVDGTNVFLDDSMLPDVGFYRIIQP